MHHIFNQEAKASDLAGQWHKFTLLSAIASTSRKRVDIVIELSTGEALYDFSYGNDKGQGERTFSNVNDAIDAYNRFKIS